MKKTWVMLLTVLALTLATVTPVVAAANRDLNIHNNTEEEVKIVLTGPKNYSFDVDKGKTIKTIQEGTYKYSYGACGEKFSGEIKVEDNLQWLIIDPCSAAPEYAKFVVDSHMEALTLKLVGPESYDLTITLGTNKFISLRTGFYAYTYDACGTTLGGEVRITKNGEARITLYSCEQAIFRAVTTLEPSNLRIGSHFAFPVKISLVGPVNYTFQLVTGLNRLNVIRGAYTYSYTAFGHTSTGSFVVGEAGVTFIISPLRP